MLLSVAATRLMNWLWRKEPVEMASTITISSLLITSAGGINHLAWAYDDVNNLTGRRLAAVEVWRATVDDRSAAVHLYETMATSFEDQLGLGGVDYFYWLHPRDRNGDYGPWYPISSPGGYFTSASQSISADGWCKVHNNLILQWGTASLIGGVSNTVIFPRSFPTACYRVVATAKQAFSATQTGSVNVISYSTSAVVLGGNLIQNGGTVSSPAMNADYIAFGI